MSLFFPWGADFKGFQKQDNMSQLTTFVEELTVKSDNKGSTSGRQRVGSWAVVTNVLCVGWQWMEGSKGAKQRHSLVFLRTYDDLRTAAGGRYMQQQAHASVSFCAEHDRDGASAHSQQLHVISALMALTP